MQRFTDKEITELYKLLKIVTPYERLGNDLSMEGADGDWNILITTDTVGLETNNG